MLITTKKLKGLDVCWLSPEGKVIIGAEGLEPFAWHMDVACHILGELYATDESYKDLDDDIGQKGFYYSHNQGFGDPTHLLEYLGWVRLHESYGRWGWVHGHKRAPNESNPVDGFYDHNDAQEKVIRKWIDLNVNKKFFKYENCFLYL